MATIDKLLASGESLMEVKIPLSRREHQKRWIYGLTDFIGWLRKDVPRLSTGRLHADDPPLEQLDNLLYRWITGGDMRYGRIFKDLMPRHDEVWEMKTADLRVFGWMFQPVKFIAVFGDYADLYKPPNVKASYAAAVRRVVRQRDGLNLDPPKLVTGTFDELVCV